MTKAKISRRTKGTQVQDSSEVFNEMTGLVKENYLLSLDSAHSWVEENKRFLDAQFENYNKIQAECANRIKSTLDNLPKEYAGLRLIGHIDRLIDMQNSHFSFVKKLSDTYTKELLDLNQKSAERTFNSVDKCASLFRS